MYVTPLEVRAMAQQMTTSAVPPATDELVRDLIERVSRLFDLEVGCKPEYFEPALHPVWESNHAYVVGDIVTPTTANAHKYRVTTAGTSAASEPTFPTASGGTVISGGVTFTENGADVIATERTFYGDGTNFLKLDPYVPGTLSVAITVPEGYTAPDFIERDGYLVQTTSDGFMLNSNVIGSFTNQGVFSSRWREGAPIIVTAKWGYASTPPDVQLAIIEWVINIWRETDPASQRLVNLDGMALRESIPPRVLRVAERYRIKTAEAVFV